VATNKSSKSEGPEAPDAKAFVRVIDDGLASPSVVSAAYQQALTDWAAGKTYAEQIRPGDVVQERPVIDPSLAPTPEARMIMLGRVAAFTGGDVR